MLTSTLDKKTMEDFVLQEDHTTLADQPMIERLPQTAPADKFNRELVRNVPF